MNERDRVLKLMQAEGMNAKQFCLEVGISQGTLSNITGGRNKPSLDVLQAILRRFRAVNCDWLIMGVGNMYLSGGTEPRTLFDEEPAETITPSIHSLSANEVVLHEKQGVTSEESPILMRKVEKIVIFYSDGTFEER